MKKLLVVITALLALPGCASLQQRQSKREMNQTVVAEVSPAQDRVLTQQELEIQQRLKDRERRKLEDSIEEYQRRNNLPSERAAKQQAELKKQDEDRLDAARARIAVDEARGYKHVSVVDFVLDKKTIPLGSKRAVSGLYQVFGEFQTLAASPLARPSDSTPKVYVITASSPREVRAKLLSNPCRRAAFCPVVLLGRTARCTIEWLGASVRNEVCLAVDETW
jgi:hypothetical protein